MTNAINAPIARIEPLIPSFTAAFGPRIDDIWSGTMTGTTVSQLANSANHSNDTAIWSAIENRPDCGTARRAEPRAPGSVVYVSSPTAQRRQHTAFTISLSVLHGAPPAIGGKLSHPKATAERKR